MSCQPAHPHFPRATRGALNALLRPAVPRSRSVSPFEDRDLHPAERVVVMAAQDTQQDDDLRGLRNRCEQTVMSGRIARNAPAPLMGAGVCYVCAFCVHRGHAMPCGASARVAGADCDVL